RGHRPIRDQAARMGYSYGTAYSRLQRGMDPGLGFSTSGLSLAVSACCCHKGRLVKLPQCVHNTFRYIATLKCSQKVTTPGARAMGNHVMLSAGVGLVAVVAVLAFAWYRWQQHVRLHAINAWVRQFLV